VARHSECLVSCRVLQVPTLVWDDALAASAARWAAGCPSGHSGYAGVGENMACELHHETLANVTVLTHQLGPSWLTNHRYWYPANHWC
jgi:hypothetical protein